MQVQGHRELTRAQVRRIDRLAVDELGIPSIVLMENAGRNAAQITAECFPHALRFVIFCGTGNNGGDGFVIARHLRNRGCNLRVYIVGDEDRLSPDAAVNHRIASRMKIPVEQLASVSDMRDACSTMKATDVVVDAMLGTGFFGAVREPMATLISIINKSPASLVAVDVPSGLDCDAGTVANVAIRADMTVTFVATKPGFARAEGPDHAGQVVVADIGTPPELIDRVGDEVPATLARPI